MVFVHARNATVKTAMAMREMAANQGDSPEFECDKNAAYGMMEKKVFLIYMGNYTFVYLYLHFFYVNTSMLIHFHTYTFSLH